MGQTLYFPLKVMAVTKELLEKKPPVSIRCFDMDEAGRDLLGCARSSPTHHLVALDRLEAGSTPATAAASSSSSTEVDAARHGGELELSVWLYFVPDCKDVVLGSTGAATEELKQVYEAQLPKFWSSLPPWPRRTSRATRARRRTSTRRTPR